MLPRVHLGEPFRFGGAGFMTLRAQHGGVRLERHDRNRVLRMLGLRAMASLASDSGMLALMLLLEDIGVAGFAGFVPGVDDGQCRNLRDGVTAVMPILAKAVRDEKGSHTKERQCPHHKQRCETEQMFGVFHDRYQRNFRSSTAAQLYPAFSIDFLRAFPRVRA